MVRESSANGLILSSALAMVLFNMDAFVALIGFVTLDTGTVDMVGR